jgi:hypothetical protein
METSEICKIIAAYLAAKPNLPVYGNMNPDKTEPVHHLDFTISNTPCNKKGELCFQLENASQIKEVLENCFPLDQSRESTDGYIASKLNTLGLDPEGLLFLTIFH